MKEMKRLLELLTIRRGFHIDARADEQLETRARVRMAHPDDAASAALPKPPPSPVDRSY